MAWLRKYWFFLGIVCVALLPLLDASGRTVQFGLWCKTHYGPDCSVFMVFLFSGMALQYAQVVAGLSDARGTAAALGLSFLFAPLAALLFGQLPLQLSIYVGLVLVAVMPSTLSSGVVMTGLAGGNMAHALLVTIAGNSLAVFTIPVTLKLMFSDGGAFSGDMSIDQPGLMVKIAVLVVLPLAMGMAARKLFRAAVKSFLPVTGPLSQASILFVIWMAVCDGRDEIFRGLHSVLVIIPVTFFFHLVLTATALLVTRILGIGKGRRESVVVMGGQKTLPLSLIVQSSLFPQFGLAVVVCVLHHIVHLAMDVVLVRYLREKK